MWGFWSRAGAGAPGLSAAESTATNVVSCRGPLQHRVQVALSYGLIRTRAWVSGLYDGLDGGGCSGGGRCAAIPQIVGQVLDMEGVVSMARAWYKKVGSGPGKGCDGLVFRGKTCAGGAGGVGDGVGDAAGGNLVESARDYVQQFLDFFGLVMVVGVPVWDPRWMRAVLVVRDDAVHTCRYCRELLQPRVASKYRMKTWIVGADAGLNAGTNAGTKAGTKAVCRRVDVHALVNVGVSRVIRTYVCPHEDPR
jgi:hypothetical protein